MASRRETARIVSMWRSKHLKQNRKDSEWWERSQPRPRVTRAAARPTQAVLASVRLLRAPIPVSKIQIHFTPSLTRSNRARSRLQNGKKASLSTIRWTRNSSFSSYKVRTWVVRRRDCQQLRSVNSVSARRMSRKCKLWIPGRAQISRSYSTQPLPRTKSQLYVPWLQWGSPMNSSLANTTSSLAPASSRTWLLIRRNIIKN